MGIDWVEVLRLVGTAVPVTVGVVLTYRARRKKDIVVEQSGIATQNMAGVEQVIDALNTLNDNLQDDNKSFRADIVLVKTEAREELAAETAKFEACAKERETYRRELNEMKRKYGENGDPPS